MDNYEEKYKSALKWMQSLYGGLHGATKEEAEKYFPELKEPNDERIRKALIEYFGEQCDMSDWNGVYGYQVLAWLEKQEEPKDKGEISDGYHTFNELYRYRLLYNAAFFNLLPKELVHKSKRHHDGEECFGGGWFIVMANLPTGQISNHYELKDWDLFQIPEKDVADKWDGHTPQEAADRLHKYLLEKQDKQPTDKVEYPHWISVEDELPRCYIPYNNWDGTPSDVLESEKVIALLSDGTICIATFNQNLDVDTDKPTGSPYWFDEGHPEDGDRIRGEVTHWMPQPPAVLSGLEIAGKKWKDPHFRSWFCKGQER